MIIASGKTTNRQREKKVVALLQEMFSSLSDRAKRSLFLIEKLSRYHHRILPFVTVLSHSMQKSELVVMSYFLDF